MKKGESTRFKKGNTASVGHQGVYVPPAHKLLVNQLAAEAGVTDLEILQALGGAVKLTESQLMFVLGSPGSTMQEKIVCRALLADFTEKELKAFIQLLPYIVGRPKETLQINLDHNVTITQEINLPDGNKLIL